MEVLPISKYGKVFKEYFIASHDLDFSKFVEAYCGSYKLIQSWAHLQECMVESFKKSNFSVLEIKTDAVESLHIRNKYWQEVEKRLV
jgi:2-succinyl-5-enolpyruvyl-6-hydroxy-3-cyclohexene-1-carboxylate synthase